MTLFSRSDIKLRNWSASDARSASVHAVTWTTAKGRLSPSAVVCGVLLTHAVRLSHDEHDLASKRLGSSRFVHNDDIIEDEVIEIAADIAALSTCFDVQYVPLRF
jgi:hypothetical protein